MAFFKKTNQSNDFSFVYSLSWYAQVSFSTCTKKKLDIFLLFLKTANQVRQNIKKSKFLELSRGACYFQLPFMTHNLLLIHSAQNKTKDCKNLQLLSMTFFKIKTILNRIIRHLSSSSDLDSRVSALSDRVKTIMVLFTSDNKVKCAHLNLKTPLDKRRKFWYAFALYIKRWSSWE